ncbi:MAG: tRNA (guanosine(37)-N1)-methyltransferase TrmD [Actinomycetota bacterium]|nr:tRNA (guanosine(37)-N1)-methyltransferase TrmD [Actinomycetota bacterium]
MLVIDVITIFPEIFKNIAEYGIIKEAFRKNICRLNVYNLRNFSDYKHGRVDGRPYGGGPGMVLMPEPIENAVNFIKRKNKISKKKRQKVILLSASGGRLTQGKLNILSKLENIILICGRYEGIDQRVTDLLVDEEISIGDYVLSGGEIPAMVMIDGMVRLLPGVVGREESLEMESFNEGLLDYPQYTRPRVFRGEAVPEVLLSGDHKSIKKWRKRKSEEITSEKRPDLFDKES